MSVAGDSTTTEVATEPDETPTEASTELDETLTEVQTEPGAVWNEVLLTDGAVHEVHGVGPEGTVHEVHGVSWMDSDADSSLGFSGRQLYRVLDFSGVSTMAPRRYSPLLSKPVQRSSGLFPVFSDYSSDAEEVPPPADPEAGEAQQAPPPVETVDSLLEQLDFDSQDTQMQEETKRARLCAPASGASGAASSAAASAAPATLSPDALVERREKFEARQLEDALCEAAQECAWFYLPIGFEFASPNDDAAESALLCIASRASVFYVGGTASVAWRWMGRWTERGWMRGHHESYSSMAVVAVRLGAAGGQLEQRCILAARQRYAEAIANVANDSRGLCGSGVNFVYIAWT